MLIQIILQSFIALFSIWTNILQLPVVTSLPVIGGYDIDSALVSGVGSFYSFINVVWPIKDLFYGFIVLIGFYTLKNVVLRLFLGSRVAGGNA